MRLQLQILSLQTSVYSTDWCLTARTGLQGHDGYTCNNRKALNRTRKRKRLYLPLQQVSSLLRLTSASYMQSPSQKGPRTMTGTPGMGSHLCTGRDNALEKCLCPLCFASPWFTQTRTQTRGVHIKASPSGGVLSNPTWEEQSAGWTFVSFTEKAACFLSVNTHSRQIWLLQCHRQKPQMTLQQLGMVSGSIILGQHKGQKKLQNLLQKQSPLEFPLTRCSWDPDWPWLKPCPPHQYRSKDSP